TLGRKQRVEEFHWHLDHRFMKVEFQSFCELSQHLRSWLTRYDPDRESQRRSQLDRLQETWRSRHGDADIMHRANINQSVKIRERRSWVGKEDVERHLGGARRRLHPSIRIAQQVFDLDPLQASERLAQPSAEFVTTPGQRNE